jgi:hypothetical protein
MDAGLERLSEQASSNTRVNGMVRSEERALGRELSMTAVERGSEVVAESFGGPVYAFKASRTAPPHSTHPCHATPQLSDHLIHSMLVLVLQWD